MLLKIVQATTRPPPPGVKQRYKQTRPPVCRVHCMQPKPGRSMKSDAAKWENLGYFFHFLAM